jgi:hypothetical protein
VALSVFGDKAHPPTPADLDSALGASARHWKRIVAGISKAHGAIDEVWNFTSAKFGWSLRVKQKERVLLYLIPQSGEFLAGVVLGEKAVKAARESSIPQPIRDLIDAAPVYAEGRGIRFPVTSAREADAAVTLVSLKLGR